MATNKTIYPTVNRPPGAIAGEDMLDNMLMWGARLDDHSGGPVGVIELNWATRDDLGYVYDWVVAGRQKPLFSLTARQATAMLGALEKEGLTPRMVCFSGADPAGHPQLGDFIELARQCGIAHVGLQCSGPRLARDDKLLDTLVRLKPLLFVEFDGFDETASLILHGRRDLPFETKRGLDRLAAAGLPAALLTGVVQGVNLQEVGAIAAFGLKHPAVFSASFRPVALRLAGLGARPEYVTAAGIMAALEQQSGSLFRRDAFSPALGNQPERHFYARLPLGGQNGSAGLTGNAPSPACYGMACYGTAPNGTAPNGTAPNDRSSFWLGVHELIMPWSKDPGQAQHCPLVIMTADGRTIPYCLYKAPEEA